MYCPKCGTDLPEGAKFCGKCGTIMAEVRERPPEPLPVGDYRAAAGAKDASGPAVKEKKFAAKSLVSLILGVGSLTMVTTAIVFLIIGIVGPRFYLSSSSYAQRQAYWNHVQYYMYFTIGFGAPGLPLGIVSFNLARNNTDSTRAGLALRKAGRILGLIGWITSAATLATAVILLTVGEGVISDIKRRYGY